jgi:ankyrin repeat protein
LAHGARVEARDKYGYTPLLYAAMFGRRRMVMLLLRHKADPKVRAKDGSTPMALAASGLYEDDPAYAWTNARIRGIIAALHARGAPIDFFTAAALGQTRRVKALLKAKPALANRKDREGNPPLVRAVNLNRKEVLILLLDRGAKPNLPGEYGKTALHQAAACGREEMVRLLIRHKAAVNAKDGAGATPLHDAALYCATGVVRILLAAGAEVNAKDNQRNTPLKKVYESDKPPAELLALFQKYGGKK